MTLRCVDLTNKFTAYIDDELSEEEENRIDEHLNFCPNCRRQLERLRKSSGLVSAALSAKSAADFDKIWRNIESQIRCRSSVWQNLCSYISKPLFWIPASATVAVVLLLASYLPVFRSPHPVSLSRVESVFSKTGDIMLFETAKTSQPIIWIVEKTPKEKHS